ncbi:MAG TPA: flavin reductase family protein [Acidimicrobiales bacterium]|nr:flavin reductase family protein [Acidimicrobiales bacterium]
MDSLEIAHFKEVLGHFVTGVVVVTGGSPGGPAGFTCQTFGSLSLEPMLISFAATSKGSSWSRVRGGGVVGLNILASEQEALARVFAQSGADKFAGVGWTTGPGGSPMLDGALAHLEGRIVDVVSYGDHDIVVVAVDFAASHPGEPLIYYRGGFGLRP